MADEEYGTDDREEYVSDDHDEYATDDRKVRRAQKFAHVRADPEKRRRAYGWFIVLAILVFIVSLVDIIMLDEVLYFGVLGAYGLLIILAIILFFTRKTGDQPKSKDMEFHQVDYTTDRDHLRCPTCRHVFAFDMQHRTERAEGVSFTCPECGSEHRLPPADRELSEAVVPGGEPEGPEFYCTDCDEHWAVGAIGHQPKQHVEFSACPHCGARGTVREFVPV